MTSVWAKILSPGLPNQEWEANQQKGGLDWHLINKKDIPSIKLRPQKTLPIDFSGKNHWFHATRANTSWVAPMAQ